MDFIQVPRVKVSFLGTVRFASRACHYEQEQGWKDDLESWLFMVTLSFSCLPLSFILQLFDLFDIQHGLQWKGVKNRQEVSVLKEALFKTNREQIT